MTLKKLTIKDKKIFDKYLRLREHELSAYAFQNIYIWRKLYDIRWIMIDKNLCVFFMDKTGCFMYLPPLGKKAEAGAISTAFEIMDKYNRNTELSRVENIEENDLAFYKKLGYDCLEKPGDYICRCVDMIGLKGDKFKRKRASYNHFVKNYRYKYMLFSLRHEKTCIDLYDKWMRERKTNNPDPVYQGMLEDSKKCLEVLLSALKRLDMEARVVEVAKQVKAFTVGFKLSKEVFCVIYEIADLGINGISQFIFREFCRGMARYKYINIMDDSGLENLKKVKMSYRPVKIVNAYIARRKT